MELFAQIADMFSDNTWNIFLVIALASPLPGALVNVFVKQNASVGSAAFVLAAYYLVLGCLYYIITNFGEPLAACLPRISPLVTLWRNFWFEFAA
jgi:hypothetical protein